MPSGAKRKVMGVGRDWMKSEMVRGGSRAVYEEECGWKGFVKVDDVDEAPSSEACRASIMCVRKPRARRVSREITL